MRLITTPESRLELSKALRLMTQALDILDELAAPCEIGSCLDLAVARLVNLLGHDEEAIGGVQELMAKLEREYLIAPGESELQPSPWDFPIVR